MQIKMGNLVKLGVDRLVTVKETKGVCLGCKRKALIVKTVSKFDK